MRRVWAVTLLLTGTLALAADPAQTAVGLKPMQVALPAQVPPYLTEAPQVQDYAPVEPSAVDGKLASLAGKRIRFGVGAGEISFSRAFDATDTALGFNVENTVRFRYRRQGPFLYTARVPETLTAFTTAEPRDIITMYMRVLKTDSGQFRLVVDRLIVMVPRK